LGDTNLRLVRTYRGVRDDVEGVIRRLTVFAERHDKDHYYEVRALDIDAETKDAAVAAWMLYLNKTGFNGLYRVNNSGGFNVPMGRYTNPKILDVPNLRTCSRALQDTGIEHEGFTAVLDRAVAGDAVYCDPPYVPLSSTASFTAYTKAGFGPQDQVALRDMALELKGRDVTVVLSNHDTPEVRELYADGFTLKRIMVGRAINSDANKRGAVAELVIW
jgi:DNA adenine methylase